MYGAPLHTFFYAKSDLTTSKRNISASSGPIELIFSKDSIILPPLSPGLKSHPRAKKFRRVRSRNHGVETGTSRREWPDTTCVRIAIQRTHACHPVPREILVFCRSRTRRTDIIHARYKLSHL